MLEMGPMGSRIEAFDDLVRTLSGLHWTWRPEGTASALQLAGFLASKRSSDPLSFRSIDGLTASIALRGGYVGYVSIVLDEGIRPDREDAAGRLEVRERLERGMLDLARRMAGLVGKPAFLGPTGEVGFPEDQLAEFVVVWPAPDHRLMLQLRQEDPALPIRLCLVIAPPGKGGVMDETRRNVPSYEEFAARRRSGPDAQRAEAVRRLHSRALSLAEVGRYDESLDAFKSLVELSPDDGVAWHDLGHLLALLGRHEESLACLDRTIALDPGNSLAWRNRGNAFSQLGRFDEAVECLERAVAIDPSDAVAWFQKGFAERNAGRHAAVRRSLRRFVDLDPPGMEEEVAKIRDWLLSAGTEGGGGAGGSG